jgi:uncharacterized RDD family membrane protein YckC
MSTTQQVLIAAQPAPLHRRFFAYLIDLTIIGAPAGAAGSLMFGPLSDLGESGRLIGAVLVALYFCYFDSRLGGGRSLGKQLLGLQVVMLTGGLMSPMSAAARALIVATPTLLNGISVGDDLAPIAGVLIVGLGLSLGYLAIFNRPSHRSLHDLATATMVVRLTAELPTARPMRRFRWGAVAIFLALGAVVPLAGLLIIAAVSFVYLAVIFHRLSHRYPHDLATAATATTGAAQLPALPPMRRFHWGVVGAFAVFGLVAPAVLSQAVDSWVDLNEAGSIGQRVEMLPGVRSAHVSVRWTREMSQASWDKQVVVVADVRDWPGDKTETANAVAMAIYRGTEKLIADAPVTVRLRRGFTLGIAHETQSERFPLEAKQWRAERGI